MGGKACVWGEGGEGVWGPCRGWGLEGWREQGGQWGPVRVVMGAAWGLGHALASALPLGALPPATRGQLALPPPPSPFLLAPPPLAPPAAPPPPSSSHPPPHVVLADPRLLPFTCPPPPPSPQAVLMFCLGHMPGASTLLLCVSPPPHQLYRVFVFRGPPFTVSTFVLGRDCFRVFFSTARDQCTSQ